MKYRELAAGGWEAIEPERKRRKPVETVGDFLEAAERVSGVTERTFAEYCRSFRLISAHVFGVKDEKGRRYDYKYSGNYLYKSRNS